MAKGSRDGLGRYLRPRPLHPRASSPVRVDACGEAPTYQNIIFIQKTEPPDFRYSSVSTSMGS